jgi:hypothetical protein
MMDPGTYKCSCPFDQWYGDNCEASEDDCKIAAGTQLCTNEGETSPGRQSHSDTALCIAFVILHTHCTGWRDNDFNVHA